MFGKKIVEGNPYVPGGLIMKCRNINLLGGLLNHTFATQR